jgi:hypothetical protein
MRRFFIGLLGFAAILSGMIYSGTAEASTLSMARNNAVQRPHDFDIPSSFCWGPTSGPNSSCIWTDGVSGSSLHNEAYFAGGHAQVYVLERAECDIIGPGCGPFTSGSGDNDLYNGDEIGTLNSVYTGFCADFPNLAGNVQNGSCSGSNGEVVVFGGGTTFSAPIVFVAASNAYYAENHRQDDSVVLAGNVNNPTAGFLGVNLGNPGNFQHDANLNFGQLGT